MPMNPKIVQPFSSKICEKCGRPYGADGFARTKSLFYPNGFLPICNQCIGEMLEAHEYEWEYVDKLCQYADIPFIPEEFEKLKDLNGSNVFAVYCNMFFTEEYEGIGWKDYFDAYKRLRDEGRIEEVLPLISDEKRRALIEKWGSNYDDEALNYLESLYDGLLMTQNVSGALQGDQALKICKISYELDCRIREGTDFDKMLASYDKLVKTAEFTPKNVKNASDFESMGELCHWLEKRGFDNQFYDGATRDVVDETIKNIQSWNQRLYTNESGIGDEITQRIGALKSAAELENYYDVSQQDNLDEYENEGFEALFKDEEFSVGLDDEDNDNKGDSE